MSLSNTDALDAFRSTARRMAPTKQHRLGIWENMLGTVYAMDAAGKIEYFDYDYRKALAHLGPHEDVRTARYDEWKTPSGARIEDQQGWQMPRPGQLVWFVKTAKGGGR